MKPQNGQVLRFRDVGVIVYGNSKKDANICNNGFGYSVKTKYSDEDKFLSLELEPFYKDSFVSNIMVNVTLLNDDGAISIQMYRTNDQSYVPEDVYIPSRNTGSKKLNQFFSFADAPLPFYYTIF